MSHEDTELLQNACVCRIGIQALSPCSDISICFLAGRALQLSLCPTTWLTAVEPRCCYLLTAQCPRCPVDFTRYAVVRPWCRTNCQRLWDRSTYTYMPVRTSHFGGLAEHAVFTCGPPGSSSPNIRFLGGRNETSVRKDPLKSTAHGTRLRNRQVRRV